MLALEDRISVLLRIDNKVPDMAAACEFHCPHTPLSKGTCKSLRGFFRVIQNVFPEDHPVTLRVQVRPRNPAVEKLEPGIVELASGLGDGIFGSTERIEQGDSGNDKVDRTTRSVSTMRFRGSPRIIALAEWTADGEPGQLPRTSEWMRSRDSG
ncbi:hypothetical protein BDV11DRAFT_174687 [Aspergillus similis]